MQSTKEQLFGKYGPKVSHNQVEINTNKPVRIAVDTKQTLVDGLGLPLTREHIRSLLKDTFFIFAFQVLKKQGNISEFSIYWKHINPWFGGSEREELELKMYIHTQLELEQPKRARVENEKERIQKKDDKQYITIHLVRIVNSTHSQLFPFIIHIIIVENIYVCIVC